MHQRRGFPKVTRPTGSDLRVNFNSRVCGDPRFGQLHALVDGDTASKLAPLLQPLSTAKRRVPLPLADNRIVFHAVERLVSPDKRIEGPIL